MTALLTAWAFAKRVPALAWIIIACVTAAGGGIAWGTHAVHAYGDRREALGVSNTQFDANARILGYQVESAKLKAKVATVTLLRDTVFLHVNAIAVTANAWTDSLYVRRARLSTEAQRDSTVQQYVAASEQLAATDSALRGSLLQVRNLTQQVDSLHTALQVHDSTMVTSEAIGLNAQRDTIALRTQERDARVTKTKVALIATPLVALAALLGHVVGR